VTAVTAAEAGSLACCLGAAAAGRPYSTIDRGLPACPLLGLMVKRAPSVAQNDGIWTASKPAAMGKQGIIQMSKLTKSSLAAKLASDRFRRVTCVIEYRPVFGPPFDA